MFKYTLYREGIRLRRFVRGMVAAGLLLVGTTASAQPSGSAPPEFIDALLQKYRETREQLGNDRHVALLNYRQPSWEPRFHIIDPGTRKILRSYVVAHGRGSDPEHSGYARRFGDEPESQQSSLGFFLTGDTYVSKSKGHGLSMRLIGLSQTNRNALERAIVIHANWYLEPGFLAQHRKPGRSYGCLVFSNRDRDEVVNMLKGGALIYAAY